MSDEGPLKKNRDGITPVIQAMLLRTHDARGGFARIYSLYQKFQTERFESQNSSEGNPWPPLNPTYAAYKPRRYGGGPRRGGGNWNSYPGAGRKMLIGTSALAGAAIGPGSPFNGMENHRALFTSDSMQISVEESGNNPDGRKFDYPHFVAEHRPFMSFGPTSIGRMKTELIKFVVGK